MTDFLVIECPYCKADKICRAKEFMYSVTCPVCEGVYTFVRVDKKYDILKIKEGKTLNESDKTSIW